MQYPPILHVVIHMCSSDHAHSDHEHSDHAHSDHEHSDHAHSDHEHSDHAHSDHAHSDHEHSDHEQHLAKIMAEVGSSTSSPGVSLHEWLDEDSKESVNDKERINTTKTR